MLQIQANPNRCINLGKRGENNAREVLFDISQLIGLFGPGKVMLVNRRPKDIEPCEEVVSFVDHTVHWPITFTATANAGYGECELLYYVNGSLAKSVTYQTYVATSVTDPETPDESDCLYGNLRKDIGDLSALKTQDKNSLVGAVNEIFESGGGGGTPNAVRYDILQELTPEQEELARKNIKAKAKEDVSLNVHGAKPGQILEVTFVDSKGKILAYKAVDKPSGGDLSGKWVDKALYTASAPEAQIKVVTLPGGETPEVPVDGENILLQFADGNTAQKVSLSIADHLYSLALNPNSASDLSPQAIIPAVSVGHYILVHLAGDYAYWIDSPVIDDTENNTEHKTWSGKAITTALKDTVKKSGDSMTGDLNMSGHKISGLPKALLSGEPVPYEQFQEAIGAIGTIFKLKGSKPSFSELPPDGNEIGDVWYVEDESVGYIWIEKKGVPSWEKFGPAFDLTGYLEKSNLLQTTGSATDNTMSQKAITDALAEKQPKGEYATKTELTEGLAEKSNIKVNSRDSGIIFTIT